ncbi:hypothetical protein CEXT_341381 [Caerostris extrusa]|uniref:Uncharacterized protein n=1 Tax=Caerostris extrusa TaxID=172846 RepID=A0AAV4SSL5_CAEEX|nr:hypothetical protein CEXT_341381 [Caerostris extrusa]
MTVGRQIKPFSKKKKTDVNLPPHFLIRAVTLWSRLHGYQSQTDTSTTTRTEFETEENARAPFFWLVGHCYGGNASHGSGRIQFPYRGHINGQALFNGYSEMISLMTSHRFDQKTSNVC